MKKMYAMIVLCLAAVAPVATAQSLIGDDYIADVLVNGAVLTTNNDTVLLGPDAIGNWFGALGYDVEAATINVESATTVGNWSGGLEFEFLDLDFLPAGVEIVGVSVINAAGAGWDQIDDSDVSFTANSVTIDASEIAGITPALDQTVTVQLITGPAAPSLIGDAYIANLLANGAVFGTNNDTALVGPDAIGTWFGAFSYDVEASSITVSSIISGSTWVSDLSFEFLDLDFLPAGSEIVGVSVTNAVGAGFDQIDTSDVSFTANSVSIDASKITGAARTLDQTVTIHLITGPSLIGDDYIANALKDGGVIITNNDTALPGPDAIGNWVGEIGYDVEADTITVSSLINDTSWVEDLAFEFLDLDFLPADLQIIGAIVTNVAGVGWDQIDNSDVSFTANSVTIDASEIGGAARTLDQTVTVQLLTGPARSLIGDDYIANLLRNGGLIASSNDTAFAGPDPDGVWNAELGHDVEASSITVSSLINGTSWLDGLEFEFLDLDFLPAGFEIVGVIVTNAAGAGWDQIDNTDVSFTATSVTIDASKIVGAAVALGQTVTVQLISAPPPSLIGDDYIADLYAFGSLFASNNDTALVGPDADGTWDFADALPYDLEADTINVESSITMGSWASDAAFEFLDLDFGVPGTRIVGVNIIRATGAGWDQIDLSDISFTDNSVRIDAAEIAGITPALDQGITIQVISGPPAPPCPGDIADDFGTIGADGMVSFGDFLALLGLVGPCPGGTPGCDGDIADDFGTLNGGDGQVSFGDFLALLGLVGPCP